MSVLQFRLLLLLIEVTFSFSFSFVINIHMYLMMDGWGLKSNDIPPLHNARIIHEML